MNTKQCTRDQFLSRRVAARVSLKSRSSSLLRRFVCKFHSRAFSPAILTLRVKCSFCFYWASRLTLKRLFFFWLCFSHFTRLDSMSAIMICVRIGETVASDTACSRSFLGVEEVIAIATGLSSSQGSCKSGCFKAHSESWMASGRTLNELLFAFEDFP